MHCGSFAISNVEDRTLVKELNGELNKLGRRVLFKIILQSV